MDSQQEEAMCRVDSICGYNIGNEGDEDHTDYTVWLVAVQTWIILKQIVHPIMVLV